MRCSTASSGHRSTGRSSRSAISCARPGLTPDHLTILGLLVGVGAAIAIGSEHLRLGLLLVILAALPDLLDGALAKAQDTSSQRGAFFDSTVDRITDVAAARWHRLVPGEHRVAAHVDPAVRGGVGVGR